MAVAHMSEFPDVPPRKRWTRTECAQLEQIGLIDGQRFELIDGQLIDKMGKSQPHIIRLALVDAWLKRIFPGKVLSGAVLDVTPEDDSTNEPQPDLIVLRRPITEFLNQPPRAADVALIIEVADRSLSLDQGTKARLYARAGIADYWVLDVHSLSLSVFRQPLEGKYQVAMQYMAQESVSPLAAPDMALRIADLIPTEN
ncbi:MAG: Uma2 family endonuclease [Bryobacteraceae bacterium]|nr:Uma2 family endonuclease [Bryobacteraceae bacterium]